MAAACAGACRHNAMAGEGGGVGIDRACGTSAPMPMLRPRSMAAQPHGGQLGARAATACTLLLRVTAVAVGGPGRTARGGGSARRESSGQGPSGQGPWHRAGCSRWRRQGRGVTTGDVAGAQGVGRRTGRHGSPTRGVGNSSRPHHHISTTHARHPNPPTPKTPLPFPTPTRYPNFPSCVGLTDRKRATSRFGRSPGHPANT